MFMKMTATEVYNKLLNDDKILTQQGRITFKFSDVDIIVKQRDVVGNIMQECLLMYFLTHKIRSTTLWK